MRVRPGPAPTNPVKPDTDADGLCDGSETVKDKCIAGEDKNNNGAIDIGETDPNNPDSDGGGVSDGDEIKRGTDPTVTRDDKLESCTCDVSDSPAGRSAISVFLLLGLLALRRKPLIRRS